MKKELKRPGVGGDVYATLTYDKDNQWIYLDWNGFLTVDLVKAGSEELLKMIIELKVAKVLVDNRKVSGPWQAANDWYANDWNPRAVGKGLRFMAVIMSDNLFTQLSLQNFEKITSGVYTVHIFNADAPARNWLKEQTAVPA